QVDRGKSVAVAEGERGLALAQRAAHRVGRAIRDDRTARLGRRYDRSPRRALGNGRRIVFVGSLARQPPRAEPAALLGGEAEADQAERQAASGGDGDDRDPERADDPGVAEESEPPI